MIHEEVDDVQSIAWRDYQGAFDRNFNCSKIRSDHRANKFRKDNSQSKRSASTTSLYDLGNLEHVTFTFTVFALEHSHVKYKHDMKYISQAKKNKILPTICILQSYPKI